MQFTKPMIELVYEIRRFAPADLKPAVKLANPELFTELQGFYHLGANAVSKALIKELFHLAGSPWPQRLDAEHAEPPQQSVRVYRGQLRLDDKAPASAAITATNSATNSTTDSATDTATAPPLGALNPSAAPSASETIMRKTRIYRGQIVVD